MKKILFIISLAFIFIFSSCKEDLNVIGDFKETAVVFGLLDQSDSIHMIKVTRAFIGPGNALEIAQIPDSSYFKSVTGTVTEYINGVPARVFTLKDTIVNNKEPNGVFYHPTQKLYYFKTSTSSPLLDNAEYKLSLNINNGQFNVYGQTKLVSGITENISGQTQPYKFATSNGSFSSTIIKINAGTAKRISSKLTIHYKEWDGTGSTDKTVSWKLGEIETSGGQISFTARGETFYSLIEDNVEYDPNVIKRTLTGITLIATGGSEELNNYILINKPTSSLSQNKPSFTNLTATNGYRVVGIFTGRMTKKVYKPYIDSSGSLFIRCLNANSMKKLCTGIYAPLLFCSDHPADISQSWYCN